MPAMDFPNSPINGQTTTDGRYYFDSSVGSTGAWRSTPLPVGGLPAGSIMAWGTNTPPANWLLADGSAVSRSVYSSLFAVIGTQYGAGDGTSTFNLPDLRGRVPVGRNGGTFGTLGATGGAESQTHSHGSSQMTAAVWAGFWKVRQASAWVATNSGGVTAPGSSSSMSNSGASIEGNTDNATVSSLPPYQVVNYIIKASAGWTAGDSELATRVGTLEGRATTVEARATALETANATTNRSGLVPVVPSSIVVSSGSATVSASGLVTFTGVLSVSLNNVFSATYRNYRMVLDVPTATGGVNAVMGLRYRTGTTDNASNLYFQYQAINRLNGALNTNSGGPNTFYSLGTIGTQTNSFTSWTGDVVMPFISSGQTAANGLGMGSDATSSFQVISSVLFNSATSFDGISIMTNSGTTITGTVKIYGYN